MKSLTINMYAVIQEGFIPDWYFIYHFKELQYFYATK